MYILFIKLRLINIFQSSGGEKQKLKFKFEATKFFSNSHLNKVTLFSHILCIDLMRWAIDSACSRFVNRAQLGVPFATETSIVTEKADFLYSPEFSIFTNFIQCLNVDHL